jgi:hypothetical protein
MVAHLKTLWLRIVNPKFASALDFRIHGLETRIKAVEDEIFALVKRLPAAPAKVEGQEEPKLRLSKSWAQRRAYLEITDGGRLTKTRES